MPALASGTLRFLLAACVVTAGWAPLQAAEGGWYTDFKTAQSRAARLNRPMLVHFYAEWCAPCKRMDRDVLHVPSVLETLHRAVVPVKLDVTQHRQLSQNYRVESVPTDLFLTPDGRVLGMMNGYRRQSDYLQRVAVIAQQFAAQQKLHWAEANGDNPEMGLATSEPPSLPEIELPSATEKRELTTTDDDAPASDWQGDAPGISIKPRTDGTILVGLEGFSPLSLYYDRAWIKGDPQYAAIYQGLTYLMTGPSELAEFQENSAKYAPQLLGCDPVIYYEQGKAIPGSTRLAVYYDDRLYLFSSTETRASFHASPEEYARHRTVLLPSELGVGFR